LQDNWEDETDEASGEERNNGNKEVKEKEETGPGTR